MKPSINILIALIESEMKWCENNPDNELTEDFRQGFIAGLIQAKMILTQVEKRYKMSEE
jgi:hypothetical protein